MKLEMIFIGALTFGIIFVVMLGLYSEGLINYGVTANTDDTFGKMTSNMKQIYDYQDSVKSNIQGGTVSEEDAVDEMVSGGYKGIRNNPFTALTVATNASMTLAQETGFLSAPIVGYLVTIAIITAIFAVVALIFRFNS